MQSLRGCPATGPTSLEPPSPLAMSGTGPSPPPRSLTLESREHTTWSQRLRLRRLLLLAAAGCRTFPRSTKRSRVRGRPEEQPPPSAVVSASGRPEQEREGGRRRRGLRGPFHLCASPAVGGARRQQFGPAFVRNKRRRRRRQSGGCPDG